MTRIPDPKKLTRADADALLALRKVAALDPLMGPFETRQMEATPRGVATWLEADHSVTIGVFGDDAQTMLLGVCTVQRVSKPNGWGLSGLYVIPAAQRRGIGRHLAECCLNHPIAAAATTFVLEVFSPTGGPDSAARELYLSLGFSDTFGWGPVEGGNIPIGLSKYTMNKPVGSQLQ